MHTHTHTHTFVIRPNTVCLPSSHGVTTVVMKNCEPLVPGPELAMDTVPALSCRSVLTISSSNSPPQMDVPPVPSPSGSPARPPAPALVVSRKNQRETRRKSQQPLHPIIVILFHWTSPSHLSQCINSNLVCVSPLVKPGLCLVLWEGGRE